MRQIRAAGCGIVIGADALAYLKDISYHKAVIVTGSSSMKKSGVLDRVQQYLAGEERTAVVYSGIAKNPSTGEILKGTEFMRRERPDLVVALGGGSTIDAAKAMTLFYEFPHITFANVSAEAPGARREKTYFVAIPTTSGTGSEVTNVTVYTDTERKIKIPLRSEALRPDVAILDADVTMTMPKHIAAETGMDALTHAIEAYTNPGLDGYIEVIARGAIEGLIEWLPVSCELATRESREKVHFYQNMAGIAFGNVGLGMVHGISHSFGAMYDLAHGLANAVILPYVMEYNSRDAEVAKKFHRLSRYVGRDIIDSVRVLQKKLEIPYCFQESGLDEEVFKRDFAAIVEHAMMGATAVNPVKMTVPEMEKMVNAVYYGTAVSC